jgi:hypothetical protein
VADLSESASGSGCFPHSFHTRTLCHRSSPERPSHASPHQRHDSREGGTPTRRQLTLFVPSPVAAHVESVRRVMDPVQSRLIPAHVTLCRSEELADVASDTLRTRLQEARSEPLTLRFGPPERFEGHGMMLGCTAGDHDFRKLREVLLGSVPERLERAHITLAHPRNPKAPGNLLANASVLEHGITVTFRTLALIEQQESDPWKVLETWELVATTLFRGRT